jgi:enamine deaminase RidA (YjgF/YER057c/UK114 family)
MSCRRIDAINKICGRAQRSALIRRQVQQLRARGEQMSSNIVRHQSDSRLSRIVTYNGTVYLAGLTADDRSATMKAQTEEVLKKIDDLLKIAGTNKSRLLSAMVYVSDMRLKPHEPPRDSRRLQTLRGWSHEYIEAILPRGSGTGGAAGLRAPG